MRREGDRNLKLTATFTARALANLNGFADSVRIYRLEGARGRSSKWAVFSF